MDILDTIIANKRREVASQKEAVTLDALMGFGANRLARPTCSMRKALEKSSSGIIAEFKRKSPSKGWLHLHARVGDVVPAYEEGGASACSVLTDSCFFGGSFSDLQDARQLVNLPLLRKDFIIDEYQIFQARIFGADAILLIASALTKEECVRFAEIAHSLSLDVLLEVHTEEELAYMNPYVDMLGINNRNLGTFDTNVERSFQLIDRMRMEMGEGEQAPLFVSESGLSDIEVIGQLRSAGFRGFLIGETFMKTSDPGETLSGFIAQINQTATSE